MWFQNWFKPLCGRLYTITKRHHGVFGSEPRSPLRLFAPKPQFSGLYSHQLKSTAPGTLLVWTKQCRCEFAQTVLWRPVWGMRGRIASPSPKSAEKDEWQPKSYRAQECGTPESGRAERGRWCCGRSCRCLNTCGCQTAGSGWREKTSMCRNNGVPWTQPGGAPAGDMGKTFSVGRRLVTVFFFLPRDLSFYLWVLYQFGLARKLITARYGLPLNKSKKEAIVTGRMCARSFKLIKNIAVKFKQRRGCKVVAFTSLL